MTPRNRQIQSETAKRSCKLTNDILEDHGDWLLVDISTDKFPNAQMAVDSDVWDNREGGRVCADKSVSDKYIHSKHRVDGKLKLFHHQVVAKVDGLEVDHTEHGSMTFIDNRRSNLRTVTHSNNCMNRGIPSNNKTGISGVSWNAGQGKWNSYIKVNGKKKHLGSFDSIEGASTARKAAEEKYFGEYAFKSEDSK